MIQPEEIRTGNYFLLGYDLIEVTSVNCLIHIKYPTLDDLNCGPFHSQGVGYRYPNPPSVFSYEDKTSYESIDPVPITEKALSLLGFQNTRKNIWIHDHYMFNNERWHISYKRKGFISFIVFNKFLRDCQYIHQIQNLYFSLTGDILTLRSTAF